MLPADVHAVFELGMRTLFSPPPEVDPGEVERWMTGRFEHLLRTDPGGAWVLERSGAVAGAAMALMREHVWGLSLLALDDGLRGRGCGRALLDATLSYGQQREARGWIVLSSENPAAMRLYARHAGMHVAPSVAALGIPKLDAAPAEAARVEDAGNAGIALADAIGRELRGAGHGPDIEASLELGCRLLVYEDRAFALTREGFVVLLGARDEEAAALALWGALIEAPRGTTAIVTFLTAAQNWAIRVCLDAGLPLSIDSPVMTRGELGPLAPYIPSGAWL
jgi:ribosomal protein S18 acetylase RimI-like enzyme